MLLHCTIAGAGSADGHGYRQCRPRPHFRLRQDRPRRAGGRARRRGVEIVSTGGTAAALTKAGVSVVDVAQVTEFPEMMDGRLKTLHPRVHGGLLAIRAEPAHQAAMIANDIRPIDLLVVNLYPFEAALARGAEFRDMIENIDIGGPAMIRAAAKNHADVVVIVDVADYGALSAGDGGAGRRYVLAVPPRHGAEGFRANGGLRRGDLQLAGAGDGRGAAALARVRRRTRLGAALRRKSASERRVLPVPREPAGRRHRAAIAGQGTLLQQHQRHRRGLRMCRPSSTGEPARRHHQARQPLRRRGRRDLASRPTRRRSPAIPSRLSAASWR